MVASRAGVSPQWGCPAQEVKSSSATFRAQILHHLERERATDKEEHSGWLEYHSVVMLNSLLKGKKIPQALLWLYLDLMITYSKNSTN